MTWYPQLILLMLPYKLENSPVSNVLAVHKAILQPLCLRQYQWYPAWQWIVPSLNGSLSKILLCECVHPAQLFC